MQNRYLLLFIALIPFITACIEYEDTITPSGKITEIKRIPNIDKPYITPDGKYLFGLSPFYSSYKIGKWSIETGEKLKEIQPDTSTNPLMWHFYNLALSKDGKYLAGDGYNAKINKKIIMIWDVVNDSLLFYQTLSWRNNLDLSFSPDNNRLFVYYQYGYNDYQAYCFTVYKFKNNDFSKFSQDSIVIKSSENYDFHYFKFNLNGEYAYFDKNAYINFKTGLLNIIPIEGGGTLNADGSLMYLASGNKIIVFDTKSNEIVSEFPDLYISSTNHVSLSPSEKYFATNYKLIKEENYVTSTEYGIQIWSGRDARLIGRIKTIYLPAYIKFVNDNTFYTILKKGDYDSNEPGLLTIYQISE